MGGRTRIRTLINILEARWVHLSDESASLRVATRVIDASSPWLLKAALEQHDGMAQILEELLLTVRAEATELRVTSLRRLNFSRPAVNLPVEILARIFEAACFTKVPVDKSPAEIYDIPLRLTRGAICSTCSHWRDVAIADPILWSTLSISFIDRRSPRHHMLPMEVARAGNSPLSLYLHADRYTDWERIGLLIASVPRAYQTIFIRVSTKNSYHIPLLLNALGASSTLRTIIVEWTYVEAPETATEDAAVNFTQLSALRDLWLCFGCHIQPAGFRVRAFLPPSELCSITRLHLEGELAVTDCWNLIVNCPCLEIMEWVTCPFNPRDSDTPLPESPYQSIVFAHLRHMRLEGGYAAGFLGFMSCPNLQNLILYIGTSDSPVWASRGRPLREASQFPSLRLLDVDWCPDITMITPFLHTHPGLEALTLGVPADAQLVDCLFPPPSCQPSIPRLSRLFLPWLLPDAIEHMDELVARSKRSDKFAEDFVLLINPNLAMSPAALKFSHTHKRVVDFQRREDKDPIWAWGSRV